MTAFPDKKAPDRRNDLGQGTENAGNVVLPHCSTIRMPGTNEKPGYAPTVATLRKWIEQARADPHYARAGQLERWEAQLREAETAACDLPELADPLAEHHREMLRASRISAAVIQARGYRTVSYPGELLSAGFSVEQARTPGLLLPGYTPDGQRFYVYRPDNPRCFEDKRKGKNPDGTYPLKVLKYEFPKGQSMRLDCPPVCRQQLADPAIPLWITEGQKKGDALASAGKCVIALLGVWNWRGINELGGRTALADWNAVALNGRQVNIIFDSDIQKNRHIQKALSNLADFLVNKGAAVKTIILPESDTRGKTGVDDWLADGHAAGELESMLREPLQVASRNELVATAEYIQVLETLGYTFRMLELDYTVEVNGEQMHDALEAEIRTRLRDAGYPRVDIARDAYIAHAYHQRYHPIKEYLCSLAWDGADHILELAGYFSDEDGVFYPWLKKWLVGAVARVFRNGAQNRVLVLDGKQDLGKSTFVRWLAGKLTAYYIESGIDPENKDDHLRLARIWIWEIGELNATTTRADRNALKQFISREQVRARPAYARNDITRPALTSFIGTVNPEGGFLNDPTGNRRFAVCALQSIDWRFMQNVDVDQVWAQAKALFDAGEDWRFTGAEKEMVNAINGRFEMENPVSDWLDGLIVDDPDHLANPVGGVTTVDIIRELRVLGARASDIALSREIGSYMKKRGVKQGYINIVKGSGKRAVRRGWLDVALHNPRPAKNDPAAKNDPKEPEEMEEFPVYRHTPRPAKDVLEEPDELERLSFLLDTPRPAKNDPEEPDVFEVFSS